MAQTDGRRSGCHCRLPYARVVAGAEGEAKYATLCSGIEACSVAWHPLGWEPVYFSEIEPFPKAVLKNHYPNVPDLGDMTKFNQWSDYELDLICAGTPCQAFSVAGLREGLRDPRGNLTLTFLGVLERYRPRWVVWENVPGVLSDRTNAFGNFLGGLAQLAYRVLDAQYFGVAQRRRRVFVVGHLGDWRPAASVLFEPGCLRGNPPPSRQNGQGAASDVAPSPTASGRGVGRHGESRGQDPVVAQRLNREVSITVTSKWATGSGGPSGNETGNIVVEPRYFEHHPADSRVQGPLDVANTVSARYGTGGGNTPMVAHAFKVRGGKDGGGKGYLGSDDTAFTIATHQDQHIAQPIPINTMTMQGRPSDDLNPRMGSGIGKEGDPSPTITKGHSYAVAQPMAFDAYNQTINPDTSQTLSSAASNIMHTGGVVTGMVVRRLTPTECERLQGFPDGYTNIPWRNKPESPDGPRYKALGNSMAVPVMNWIGRRIQEIDKHL